MLHIINQSPFESNILQSCLRLTKANDAILFIEDGVTAALQKPLLEQATQQKINLYALQPDLEARGLLENISPLIKLIDYAGFVELTTQHHPIQSWT